MDTESSESVLRRHFLPENYGIPLCYFEPRPTCVTAALNQLPSANLYRYYVLITERKRSLKHPCTAFIKYRKFLIRPVPVSVLIEAASVSVPISYNRLAFEMQTV